MAGGVTPIIPGDWSSVERAFNELSARIQTTVGRLDITSHDDLADVDVNQHIDWTSATANISTSGNIRAGVFYIGATWRIVVSGSHLQVQKNTGTEGSPVWTFKGEF